MNEQNYIELALKMVDKAIASDNNGIGAVVVKDGNVISAYNTERETNDLTAHAEITAIRKAQKEIDELTGATIYCSLEPCVMCSGAILFAGIKKVVYVKEDKRCSGIEELKKYGVEVLKVYV